MEAEQYKGEHHQCGVEDRLYLVGMIPLLDYRRHVILSR